jgi:hypothetical protein
MFLKSLSSHAAYLRGSEVKRVILSSRPFQESIAMPQEGVKPVLRADESPDPVARDGIDFRTITVISRIESVHYCFRIFSVWIFYLFLTALCSHFPRTNEQIEQKIGTQRKPKR